MNIRKQMIVVLALAWVLGGAASGLAQPDLNNQPKGPNPVAQAGEPDWANMTAEQRRQAIQKTIDETLRGSLNHLGYTDKALQDTIVAYAMAQEQTLEPVRGKHRKVAQALLSTLTSDEDIAVLMDDLRDALEEAKVKREETTAALNEKIDLAQMPRLAAFLAMMGLTGEETSVIGGVVGNFTGTLANLAVGWADEAAQR